jgi:large subunit ribosomal protein LP1
MLQCQPILVLTMVSVSELTSTYYAFILHDNEVTITEDKINVLIKVSDVNVAFLQPDLFAKANVNMWSLTCNVGAGRSALAAGAAPAKGPVSSTTAGLAEKEKQREESEESDGDMGFGLLD